MGSSLVKASGPFLGLQDATLPPQDHHSSWSQAVSATEFDCHIITPSGPIFEGKARYVSFPAWDGQYGVMAGMAPILSRMGEGELRIDGPQASTMRSRGGFAHVKDGVLTLLPDEILDADASATDGD